MLHNKKRDEGKKILFNKEKKSKLIHLLVQNGANYGIGLKSVCTKFLVQNSETLWNGTRVGDDLSLNNPSDFFFLSSHCLVPEIQNCTTKGGIQVIKESMVEILIINIT